MLSWRSGAENLLASSAIQVCTQQGRSLEKIVICNCIENQNMLQGCNAPRRSITRLAIFNEPPKLIDAANGLQDKSVARPLRKRAVKIAVAFEVQKIRQDPR